MKDVYKRLLQHFVLSSVAGTIIILFYTSQTISVARVFELLLGSLLFSIPMTVGVAITHLFENDIKKVVVREIFIFLTWFFAATALPFGLLLLSSLNNDSTWAVLGAIALGALCAIVFAVNYIFRLVYVVWLKR